MVAYISNYGADTYGLVPESTTAALKEILDKANQIERRILPERVADILEQAGFGWGNEATIVHLRRERVAIAKALRTGDTRKIKEWCK